MGPRRYWGAPPPLASRKARADYFADWSPSVLPRREGPRSGGRRAYEVRVWMTGIVYVIDDDLSAVAPVDLAALQDRLDAFHAAPVSADEAIEMAVDHRAWLGRALQELFDRSGALAAGTAIPKEDWHLRDLERLRRVVARAADHLLPPPPAV